MIERNAIHGKSMYLCLIFRLVALNVSALYLYLQKKQIQIISNDHMIRDLMYTVVTVRIIRISTALTLLDLSLDSLKETRFILTLLNVGSHVKVAYASAEVSFL